MRHAKWDTFITQEMSDDSGARMILNNPNDGSDLFQMVQYGGKSWEGNSSDCTTHQKCDSITPNCASGSWDVNARHVVIKGDQMELMT